MYQKKKTKTSIFLEYHLKLIYYFNQIRYYQMIILFLKEKLYGDVAAPIVTNCIKIWD